MIEELGVFFGWVVAILILVFVALAMVGFHYSVMGFAQCWARLKRQTTPDAGGVM